MSYKKVNLFECTAEQGKNTFGDVLQGTGTNVIRDTLMLLREKDTETGRISVGYTVIYPHCSTRGHEHPPLEEVYFVTSGKGIMEIGSDRFEVTSGDVVYIPGGEFHRAENPFDLPLEYVWVTVKKGQ
ncbi:MAG: cupin domain-containing protein [Atribacterota bacterium]